MKLFTKDIDDKLFKQYPMGGDLATQKVVAKIFNPYGRGTWYLINSDPSDPDYLWAIVDLFEIEVGSVSRMDLETIKVPPFKLGLERDTSFTPKNALEVYQGLREGKHYKDGGMMEDGGMSDSMKDVYDRINKQRMTVRSKVALAIGIDNALEYMDKDYVVSPFKLLEGAVMKGFIKVDEIDERLWDAAVEEANDIDSYYRGSGEGIGGSDMNGFISSMLNSAGIKVGVVNNRYERMEHGGSIADSNKEMLLNQAEGFEHHADELEEAAKKADEVPAWVVAKSQRASTDLSDITHYLDGMNEQKREMKEGEEYAKGGEFGVDKHRVYFSSFAEVMDAIHDIANENGYNVVDIFPDLSYGGVSYGQTKKAKVELEWNGKEKVGKSKKREKNTMNVQIYRMDSGNYELNTYFSYAEGGYMEKGDYIIKGNISDIQTPFYFKSKIGIEGMDKDATFQIQSIPNYGNIKVYYYNDTLPMFFYMYKDELEKRIDKGDIIKSYKSQFQPNIKKGTFFLKGGYMADGGKIKDLYEDWEMVIISKGLEKDGGQYIKNRYLVSAKDIEQAKKIATELWEKEMGNSDFHIVKVMSDSLYRLKYMDKYADGGYMAKGGETDNYQKFDLNSEGNFASEIDGKKYEIIYRDDKTQLYDLFENGKKIKSSKNIRDVFTFKDGGYMAKGGILKGKLIHKESGVEYYKDDSLINPTKSEKLNWEIYGLPKGVEKIEQSFETIIDEYYGTTKKEIQENLDKNMQNGKYEYLGVNPNLELSFDNKMAMGGEVQGAKYYELTIEDYKGTSIIDIVNYDDAIKKYHEYSKNGYDVALYAYKDGREKHIIRNNAYFIVNKINKEIVSGGYINKDSANRDLIIMMQQNGDVNYNVEKIKKEVTEIKYADGGYMAMGGVTFDDKVKAVKSSLLKRKKVSPSVQKDYGKTYSPKEAEESAKRIVGAMTARERMKMKMGKKK